MQYGYPVLDIHYCIYSTVQYCTVLYSAVQCCTVLYSTQNHIKLFFKKSIFWGLTLWICRVECGDFHCANGVIVTRRKWWSISKIQIKKKSFFVFFRFFCLSPAGFTGGGGTACFGKPKLGGQTVPRLGANSWEEFASSWILFSSHYRVLPCITVT